MEDRRQLVGTDAMEESGKEGPNSGEGVAVVEESAGGDIDPKSAKEIGDEALEQVVEHDDAVNAPETEEVAEVSLIMIYSSIYFYICCLVPTLSLKECPMTVLAVPTLSGTLRPVSLHALSPLPA